VTPDPCEVPWPALIARWSSTGSAIQNSAATSGSTNRRRSRGSPGRTRAAPQADQEERRHQAVVEPAAKIVLGRVGAQPHGYGS